MYGTVRESRTSQETYLISSEKALRAVVGFSDPEPEINRLCSHGFEETSVPTILRPRSQCPTFAAVKHTIVVPSNLRTRWAKANTTFTRRTCQFIKLVDETVCAKVSWLENKVALVGNDQPHSAAERKSKRLFDFLKETIATSL